jgi:WD40 repeat protein
MVWDLEDGDLLFDLNGHEAGVNSIAFSPDGSLLATGSNDSKVRLWNTEDGSVVRTLNSNLAGRALSVAFSPNGDMIAIGGHLCTVELRLVSTGLLTRTIRIPFCNNALNGSVKYLPLVFSPDGTQIAIGSGLPGTRGRIFLVKMERYSTPQLIADFDMLVSDLDFNERELFLAASLAGSSRVWLMDARNGVVRNIFKGHSFRVKTVSFSPDGQLLATGSRDGTMRLWGTNIGMLLRVFEIDPSGVNQVVFSPDGSKIATGTASGQVVLWSLAPAK